MKYFYRATQHTRGKQLIAPQCNYRAPCHKNKHDILFIFTYVSFTPNKMH